MKKQYIFLVLIIVMLYELFLIFNYKYKEYKINSWIEYIISLNNDIKNKIKEAENLIEYKKSKAYKNKIMKEQQSLKNKWEKVVYLTPEKKFNTFTKKSITTNEKKEILINNTETSIINNMSIYEKWIYFLFKKDIR